MAGDAAKPARPPLAEIVLHPAFNRLAEQTPRLPRRTRHDGDVLKFLMGILRAITATKGLHKPNDFAALLKASLHHRDIDVLRQEGIGGDHYMTARHQNPH